jgi:MFS family permease
MTIGFYYMANAGGRLFGTLLSGFLYYYIGISACLIASAILIIITLLISTKMHDIKEE